MPNNPLYLTTVQILSDLNVIDTDTVLSRFYKTFHVVTLGDVFGVPFLNDVPYDQVFLPWLHFRPVSRYRDTAFIDVNVSEKINKLRHLILSIRQNGWAPKDFPDRGGGLVGYRLKMDNAEQTYIVKGNHRVAVLSAMQESFVITHPRSALMKPRDKKNAGVDYDNLPAEFSNRNVQQWPSVVSGFLTKKQALQILHKYFETNALPI